MATLRVPYFGAFWVASLFYFIVFGTQIFAFAWLVLELSDSAAQSAFVVFTLGIPALFVSLPAGVLFDRVDRRSMIIVATTAAAIVLLAMALVIAAGAITVPLAILFALALGVAFGANLPGIQAVVPTLVPPERLLSAISLQTMGMTAGLAVGAAVGGLVIDQVGIAEAFFMQAGLLFLSAVLMLRVRIPRPPAEATARPLDMRGEIAEGARFIMRDRGLLGLMALMAVVGLLMLGPVFALIPDVARSKLGQDAGAAGLLFAVTGVGIFAISFGLAAIGRMPRMGLVFTVATVTGGFFLIGMGLSEMYLLTALIMFGWGLGGGFVVNTNRTLIQSRTPPAMMGRVMAFYALAFGAARPLGSLLAAGLAAWIGSEGALIFSGIALIVITTLFLVTQRDLRQME
jgi:MFS family permease